MTDLRIGHGYDVHAACAGDSIILGGVRIHNYLILTHRRPDGDTIGSAAALCRGAGYEVVNVDSTIVAQSPKMAPHINAMRENLAAALGVPVDRVNVKATTEEHLGFTGRGEGIAAHAVALVEMFGEAKPRAI